MNRFKTSLAQTENRGEDKVPDNKPEEDEQTDVKAVISSIHDIFADAAPKKRGRELTVYLTSEVWEAVSNLSEQRNISKSRIVDKALREVLKIR